MRVAYDATALVAGDTGVARYTRLLAEALERRGDIELVRFAIGRAVADDADDADDGEDAGSGRRVRVPLRVVHASWELLHRPRIERLLRADVDVVHSLDMVPPPSRHPVVVTVHDLLPLDLPHSYARRNVRIAAAQARAIREAAMVVTTCEATADAVVTHTAIARDRIVIAPPAPRAPSPVAPPSPVDGPYLLAVGAVTPRKGVGVLAEALARIPDAPPLVVAGPDGWRADEVRRRVSEAGMDGRVRWLGRVDDDQLEGLYRHATLLCHVSEAEGFGIPCLEAMAYGVPVIATDLRPTVEIGGNAIGYVPVGDPAALATAIAGLLADEPLRAELARRGPEQAAGYTWDRAAAAVADAYHRALEG